MWRIAEANLLFGEHQIKPTDILTYRVNVHWSGNSLQKSYESCVACSWVNNLSLLSKR